MISIEYIEQRILAAKRATLEHPLGTQLNPGTNKATLTLTDKIAARILYILSNEQIFQPSLAELNQMLGTSELPTRPVNYVEIHSTKLPAPPSSPLREGPLLLAQLSTVLLKQEQKHGINTGRRADQICRFVGPVPSAPFEEFVNQGNLWEDYNYDITGLYHGRYSHRIQYYVITRAIEKDPSILGDIALPQDLLKLCVSPAATFQFVFPTSTRAYWNLVFENDRHKPSNYFIRQEINITGPAMLMEYLLSQKSFTELPALAHSIHHSMCQPLFYIASKMEKRAFEVLKEYSNLDASGGRCKNQEFATAYAAHLRKTLSNPATTSFPGNVGALYLYKSIYKAVDNSSIRAVTVKTADPIEQICQQFKGMKIAAHPNSEHSG